MTPETCAAALRDLGDKGFRKAVSNGLRRGIRAARADAVATGSRIGILRGIFGTKPGGLRALVKTVRVARNGSVYTAGMQVKGVAAMVEEGGRIKPHTITPKNASVLAFKGGAGFARSVQHPGAAVPKRPFIGPALQRGTGRVVDEIDKGLAAAIAEAGLR